MLSSWSRVSICRHFHGGVYLSCHKLVLSCKECLLSLIPTDLYIRSARLAVRLVKFSSVNHLFSPCLLDWPLTNCLRLLRR